MSLFGDLDKSLAEGRERWEKIEREAEVIKEHLTTGRKMNDENVDRLANLVLMLIEHMQPMQPSEDQLSGAMQEVENMLKKIKRK